MSNAAAYLSFAFTVEVNNLLNRQKPEQNWSTDKEKTPILRSQDPVKDCMTTLCTIMQ